VNLFLSILYNTISLEMQPKDFIFPILHLFTRMER
jgi:hypothetical protein